MRQIRIYDPRRIPPNWTETLEAHQYAVFQHESATGLDLGPDGCPLLPDGRGDCLVFDTLQEAETYCLSRVEKAPRIACEVFDKAGRANAPVKMYTRESVEAGPRAIWKSRFFWAHVMTACAVVGFVIDWRSDGERMWPTILGLKFLTLAVIFYVWGLAERLRGRRLFKNLNR